MPELGRVSIAAACLMLGFFEAAGAASTDGEALPATPTARHAKSAPHKLRHVHHNAVEAPAGDAAGLSRSGLRAAAGAGPAESLRSPGIGGWSLAPKVSATNQASPGAYSTRALYDQLNSRSNDQDGGYRAGAELKFKF